MSSPDHEMRDEKWFYIWSTKSEIQKSQTRLYFNMYTLLILSSSHRGSKLFVTNTQVNKETTKGKKSQLPGTLHTVVCIALPASVKYRGCIPWWRVYTIQPSCLLDESSNSVCSPPSSLEASITLSLSLLKIYTHSTMQCSPCVNTSKCASAVISSHPFILSAFYAFIPLTHFCLNTPTHAYLSTRFTEYA